MVLLGSSRGGLWPQDFIREFGSRTFLTQVVHVGGVGVHISYNLDVLLQAATVF